MKIDENYLHAYENMDKIISGRKLEGKYPALGYTSNLDVLCDFQTDRLNQLLEKYMPEANLNELKDVKVIRTMEEFLRTVVFFCHKGIGGEVDIDNFDSIKNSFASKLGIGGTAMQAAMALATIGLPSIVHLTDNSREVCDILNSIYIYTVDDKEKLIHTNDVIQSNEQEIHYIIQFQKGDIIRLGDQMVVIPVSNRLIITKITVNQSLPFSKSYFNYIEKNANHISSNVLSSFNALYDVTILQERLEYVKNHIRKYKANNKKGIVFFEDAHYHSDKIRKSCLETIYSQVDIVSLNEEELAYMLKIDGVTIDIDDIISCINGMGYIKEKYEIKKGVIVHTKDYSMYVGVKLGFNIESGLIYGNMLATTKAMFGWYGTRKQIKEVLKLPLSEKGCKNKRIIEQKSFENEVVLVPTKYMDRPKYTIGLGDSFVAGVQMCFDTLTNHG